MKILEDERDHYCVTCLEDKPAKQFTIWIEDKTKGRCCDSCHDVTSRRIRNIEQQAARRAKAKALEAKVTPILVDLSSNIVVKKRVETRRSIEEIKEQLQINREDRL